MKTFVGALAGHARLQSSKRFLVIAVLTCCIGLTFFYTLLGTNHSRVISFAKSSVENAKSSLAVFAHQSETSIHNLSYLAKHDLTPNVSYSRRAIKTEHFNGDRSMLSVINKTLPSTAQILGTYDLSSTTITSLQPLTLRVPNSPKVGSCIFSFGMSTTIPRLQDSIPQIEHWLSNTDCPFNVHVSPHEDDLNVQESIRNLSINATITTIDLDFAKSYFSLIKSLYASRTPSTKWLVLMDDDTFVPSLQALTAHFVATYDPTEETVISATSDDLNQIRIFGLIPFGGGGVFISVPLAERLLRPGTWEACLAIPQVQGDGLLNDCLARHSITRPIIDHGLNQMDIRYGDRPEAGYMESGRRMLTIHHWKSWFQVDMPKVAKVAKVTGDEGVLMRWIFEDNLVLSNGYSIVEYVDGVEGIDFDAVELTWADIGEAGTYWHHVGPLREKLGKDKKRSYLMVEAEVVEEGVRQIYIYRAGDVEDGPKEIDRVIELTWLF